MATTTKLINVAIDGPAGAGKSTVARLVARAMGYIYVDTGAMYRAVTLYMLRAGLQAEHEQAVSELAASLDIRLEPGAQGQRVYANDEEVTDQIRTTEVAAHVSQVARIAEVRSILVRKQQEMAARGGVVMDGRDIGSHVLPNAEVKVFMTASVEERARRRYEELKDKDSSVTYEQLVQDISLRDDMDRNREVSPLIVAEDAHVLDTTHLTIEQAVDMIVERCQHVLR